MKILHTIKEQDIYPDALLTSSSNFSQRTAARAIVVNAQGKIPLLRVGRFEYHKLPGGGINAGEGLMEALQRELLEELGCRAEITGEVGKIVEYRDQEFLIQISHCYLGRQIGDHEKPNFTKEELKEGFEIVWVTNLDEAIATLKKDKPMNYEGPFIQRRDLTFLKAAKNLSLISRYE